MKFTIVTPCLDRHRFLDETIRSVVNQRGDFEIEYIIQDGGSGPEVLEILEKWKNRIDSGVFEPACRSLTFQYFTEPDSGMYDAINKGFAQGTGELLAWINSDDSYFPSAFAAVHQAMTQHEDVDWLIGKAAKYNAPGNVTYVAGHPNCYSRKFINLGYYRNELFNFSCDSAKAFQETSLVCTSICLTLEGRPSDSLSRVSMTSLRLSKG